MWGEGGSGKQSQGPEGSTEGPWPAGPQLLGAALGPHSPRGPVLEGADRRAQGTAQEPWSARRWQRYGLSHRWARGCASSRTGSLPGPSLRPSRRLEPRSTGALGVLLISQCAPLWHRHVATHPASLHAPGPAIPPGTPCLCATQMVATDHLVCPQEMGHRGRGPFLGSGTSISPELRLRPHAGPDTSHVASLLGGARAVPPSLTPPLCREQAGPLLCHWGTESPGNQEGLRPRSAAPPAGWTAVPRSIRGSTWPGHAPGRGLLLSSERRQQPPRAVSTPAPYTATPPREWAGRRDGAWDAQTGGARTSSTGATRSRDPEAFPHPSGPLPSPIRSPSATVWGWPGHCPTLGEGHWPGLWSPWVPFKEGRGEGGRRCGEAPERPRRANCTPETPPPRDAQAGLARPAVGEQSPRPGTHWLLGLPWRGGRPLRQRSRLERPAALISRLVRCGLVAGL